MIRKVMFSQPWPNRPLKMLARGGLKIIPRTTLNDVREWLQENEIVFGDNIRHLHVWRSDNTENAMLLVVLRWL